MCLILFAYKCHPRYKLIFLANRDEFYQRPSLPLDYWPDAPDILAGRDLEGKGTWMGLTRTGRLAAITNFRAPADHRLNAPSRGLLVSNYLNSRTPAQEYLQMLLAESKNYNGFNLLAGDSDNLHYFSNQTRTIEKITPGIHGLSNHLLDTPWPKVVTGKKRLETLLNPSGPVNMEDLFTLLADRSMPEEKLLPDTGIGFDWERILAPLFIVSPGYGTRCSSIVLIENSGRIQFAERTYPPGNELGRGAKTRTFILEP